MIELLLAAILAVPAPETTGRLIDARTRAPVSGAEVTIAGQRGSVRTDAAGRFSWPTPLVPPFVIVVLLPGDRVATPVRIISLGPGPELVIPVEAGISESVTVHGAAPGVDIAAGTSAVLITAADVAMRQPVTFTGTLENVPGIAAISEGQSATPAVRGLARGRTLVLVDGARVSTERGAGASASFVDPGTLAAVEVARGPGSVAYGSDAFGGVIMARTRRPAYSTPFSARLMATGAAGLPEWRADLEINAGYGDGGLLAGMRWRELGDYSSPDGVVSQSSWRDAGVRLRWEHARGRTLWSIGWQSNRARDIRRPRSDSATMLASSPVEDSHRLTFSMQRAELAGFSRVRVEAFAGGSRERIEQQRLPGPGRTRRIDRADSSARDTQVRLTGERTIGRVRWQTGADVHGRFGLESTDTTFTYNAADVLTSTVVEPSIGSARRIDLGLFTQAEMRLGSRVLVHGGLRGDAVRSVNRGGFFGDRRIARQAFAGATALTLQATRDLSVTAQVARGFRDPTLSDRFARGPVGRGFVEGNPDLDSETSLQFDVTARYTAGPIRIQTAGYRYALRDMVERFAAGADLFRFRNRGRARLTGLEIETRIAPGHGLTVDLAAETMRGRDPGTGIPLDDVAPRRVSLTARHAHARLTSYVRLARVARHDSAGPGEVPTPGYSLIDAGAEWRLSALIDLRALVRNALDASYYSSAGPRWVWAPGRSVTVTGVFSLR